MPDLRQRHWLGRALPSRLREEIFDPAMQDLRVARMRGAHQRSRAGRAVTAGRFVIAAVVLLIQSLAVAAIGAMQIRRRQGSLHDRSRSKEALMTLMYHLRHGLRLLRRQPLFTTAAVLTLALGIGANAAVFAVVEAVLLRPLPYPAADDLVVLRHRDERTGITKQFIAIGDYLDLTARQTSVEMLGAYGSGSATVTTEGDPFLADALQAGPGFLDALRVRPAAGRLLEPGDSRQGAAPVVVLGYALWQERFRGDAAVIGRRIRVGNTDREIVGIASAGFRFPPTADTAVILPQIIPPAAPASRKSGWVFAVGRLKPGATNDRATADVGALSEQLEREHPEQNSGSRYYTVPLRDELVGRAKQPLVLMLAAVGVVLLIACANVGNLMLARALGRRQEMAVRRALGASRGQVVTQLLAENLALALAAAMVGIAGAYWGLPALVSLVPSTVSAPGLADVGINVGVLAFTLALTLVTTVVFGLITAAGAVTARGGDGFSSPTRVTASLQARRAASVLVVSEIALAIVLLISAGLILRSSARLLSVDPGFDRSHVTTIDLGLPAGPFQPVGARQRFYLRAFAALRAVPGVQTTGVAVVVPLTGNNWTVGFERADRPLAAGERPPDVGWQSASGGFFETLNIPLKAGRYFAPTDGPDSPPVVIISEAIERRFFPGESAVGRRVRLGQADAEIVGVVGNIRRAALTDEPREDMYLPFERQWGGSTTLFIRTAEASPSVRAVTDALRAIEPRLIIGDITTLDRVAAASMAETTLVLWLLGIFAGIALSLAAIGVYGVMAYAVRQRSREIGMRIALGATRLDITWLIARQGAIIAAAGLSIGVVGGLMAARSLSSMLFEVSPADPRALAGAVLVLTLTLALACYLPARRASRLDAARTLSAQ